MTLTPAYGRDYKSKAAILADLRAGKDFVLHTFDRRPTYVSIAELRTLGTREVTVRYDRQRKVAVLKVPAADAAHGVTS